MQIGIQSAMLQVIVDVATDNDFSSLVKDYNNKDVNNVITYPVTNLSSKNQYYYRVRAYNNAGTSSNSNVISILLVNVNGNTSGIPTEFMLDQNYPNPFNPTATINYALPKSGLVKIIICDILGREVKTLVNEEKTAGYYSIQFNGNNLTSGIYFYRMQSGNFVETKKLILLK